MGICLYFLSQNIFSFKISFILKVGYILNYAEIVHFLFNRQQKEMKLGLKTIKDLLKRLNNPECRFLSIHIAGTNGKGSTAALLESVLRHAGYKTGLYTSPHLVDMRERIQIGGKPILKKEIVAYTRLLLPHIIAVGASYFETLTAMAFLAFADRGVDAAVLETGLGGRLDATNVVHPRLTLITEIGLEHTNILGKTLSSITEEKAGIFKPKVPAIIGTNRARVKQVLARVASAKKVPLLFSNRQVHVSGLRLTKEGSRFNARTDTMQYDNLFLKLIGRHQIENARMVLLAVDVLRKAGWNIPEKAVRLGFKNVNWRARLELLGRNPDVLLDSAHNPLGISTLTKAIRTLFKYNRLILVFGVLQDKNYRKMLKQIAPLADTIILTRPKSERALDPKIMEPLSCLKSKTVHTIPDIRLAWRFATQSAKSNDLVCGTGSIYFVGEVLRLST